VPCFDELVLSPLVNLERFAPTVRSHTEVVLLWAVGPSGMAIVERRRQREQGMLEGLCLLGA
ncbi:MAG TPA: hypothetical protein VGK55_03775, partial [Actinomycetes bacterium]